VGQASIGGVNWSCYSNPAFDADFEMARVTPSGPARMELFRTIQTRLDATTPMRRLPVGDSLNLKRGDVVGRFQRSTTGSRW
jgi:hypothetical protein